jgi:hypothetical protein
MYGAMYGDFSRLTFDPERGYSAVVAFQGRVNVEADANEHTQILLHYLRTLATDLLGPAAWPEASRDAFAISVAGDDLSIERGRCYVDGLLVANEVFTAEDDGQPIRYFAQPHSFLDPERDALPDAPYWVYLKVWERLLTGEDFPDMRDVALGHQIADSSGRLQVVWQVVAVEASSKANGRPGSREAALTAFDTQVRATLEPRDVTPGQLRAWATEPTEDELCATSPRAHYRGLENQLYRVEIHRGGQATAGGGRTAPTFKWSRDNGSVVFPIAEVNGSRVTVSTLGRDDRYALEVGDWVEVVDDAYALAPDRQRDDRERLYRVELIEPADFTVTLDRSPGGAGTDPDLHPLLRLWDHQEGPRETGYGIPLAAGEEFELEDGVKVEFGEGTYRSGDYWVIPARVETGDVEWPRAPGDDERRRALFRRPHGVAYRYAPLAFVNGPDDVMDLRCVFQPIACSPGAAEISGEGDKAGERERVTARRSELRNATAAKPRRKPTTKARRRAAQQPKPPAGDDETQPPGATGTDTAPQPENQ